MEEPSEIEQWKRISILGSGAFGVVALWKHNSTSEYIAVKKCKFMTGGQLTPRQKIRWENEVNIMKSLDCPNIVGFKPLPKHLGTILDRFNPTKLPLLSMEYCEKGNLRHALNQVNNSSGLPETDVRNVLRDIATGVYHLHQNNITHRDIKPENIVVGLCDYRPGGLIYKIIDLGYAKELNDSTVSFVGTLHYIAPEIMMTENYDCSVDYWSLGIVAFEVVCGVLPFLPQFTPVARFPFIEKKKPETICIYQMHSGSVAHSSELLKENHISSCLQQHLEIWLRHVLQFNPASRQLNFPNNTNVFEYLLNILDTRIVNVYSVHTLEFYSYEINESTLIGTLKDWIPRDTKVKRQDQVLLTDKTTDDKPQDDDCVVDILSTDFYVFKKGAFINRENFTLPKYVRVLFENVTTKYKWRELRLIYTKSLYFLSQEEKMITSLLRAFKLYNAYVRNLNSKLKNKMQLIHKTVTTLIGRVDCYYNIHNNNFKKVDIDTGESYTECLQNFQQMMIRLEQYIRTSNNLLKSVQVLIDRQVTLDAAFPKVSPVTENCDLSTHVAKACELLMKGGDQGVDLSSREMVKIVSNALKDKDKLLNNNNFQHYAKAISVAVRDLEMLLDSMENFQGAVKELATNIDNNQKEQYRILLTSDKPKKTVSLNNSYSNNFVHLDTDTIIKENQDIRCQFADALGEMLASHKSVCDEIHVFLNNKF